LAQKLVKLLIQEQIKVKAARVGILGLTFKENVHDIRNSKVPDIVRELGQFGITPMVCDPLADPDQARHEYGLELAPLREMQDLDALVLAVSHAEFLALGAVDLARRLCAPAVFIDAKACFEQKDFPGQIAYWSL
jgi:UDP-N-acetyl-D-galactosamine dehydrogenase